MLKLPKPAIKLTQQQLDDLEEIVRHQRHESGSVSVPYATLLVLLNSYTSS